MKDPWTPTEDALATLPEAGERSWPSINAVMRRLPHRRQDEIARRLAYLKAIDLRRRKQAAHAAAKRDGEVDHLSAAGAEALARRIEAFWRGRVRCVRVELNAGSTKVNAGVSIWMVRSDLRNGLPRG